MHSPLRLSSPLVRYIAMAVDVLIIWASGAAVFWWYEPTASHDGLPDLYKLVMLAASLVLLGFANDIYRSWRVNEMGGMLRSMITAWLCSVAVVLMWLFLDKASSELSRVWFVGWTFTTLVLLCLQRGAVYGGLRWLRMKGYNYKTVLLVGAGRTSQRVQNAMEQSAWSGLRLTGIVSPEQLAGFLGDADRRAPDEVWMCLNMGDRVGISTTMAALRHSTANVRLVPDVFAHKLLNHGVSEVMGIAMVDLSASPVTGATRLLKALQDRVLAACILVVISPAMLGLALAVKLTSKGPVFYKQRRHGWNGEQIWVYKFRSMFVHQEGEFQVTQASKNDKRITPLGAFMRRTSLDELPQFINVLQGRMSIVGPRPHAVVHNEFYKELVPGYMLRHKVKPGITGWAQINGFRGETDTLDKMEKRVEYDLHYIENLSLALDLKIILLTVAKGFTHRNAY